MGAPLLAMLLSSAAAQASAASPPIRLALEPVRCGGGDSDASSNVAAPSLCTALREARAGGSTQDAGPTDPLAALAQALGLAATPRARAGAGADGGALALAAAPQQPQEQQRQSPLMDEVWAPLRNNFDMVYTVQAEIGEPPVRVRMILDTGSSDVWVKASSAAAPFGLRFGGGKVYDPNQSDTAVHVPGDDIAVSYGQGRVLGRQVRDRICLGNLCVNNQSFIFANQVMGIPNQWLFDGILGLGYPELANPDHAGATFVQSLNSTFRHLAVAFSLGGASLGAGASSAGGQGAGAVGLAGDHGAKEGGYLKVGELDDLEREARGELGRGVTLPLFGIGRHAMFWLVQASVAVVPGGPKAPTHIGAQRLAATAVSGPSPAMAILDSGTSLIGVPEANYKELVGALTFGRPNAMQKCTTTLLSAFGQLMCSCDAELNPLTVTLEGDGGRKIQVTLKGQALMQVVGFGVLGQGLCRISVQPTPPGMPLWILGDVFLRHVYAVHDVPGHAVELYPEPGSEAAAVFAEQVPAATAGAEVEGPAARGRLVLVSFLGLALAALMGAFVALAAVSANRGALVVPSAQLPYPPWLRTDAGDDGAVGPLGRWWRRSAAAAAREEAEEAVYSRF